MVSLNSLERTVLILTLTVFLGHFGIHGQPTPREKAREALLKIANEDARDISDDVLEARVADAVRKDDDDVVARIVQSEIRIRYLPFVGFEQECFSHSTSASRFPSGFKQWKSLGVNTDYAAWRERAVSRFIPKRPTCNPFMNLYCEEIDQAKRTGKCKCREGAYYKTGHERTTPSGKPVDPRDMCVLLPGQRCDVDSDEEGFKKWPREQLDVFTLRPSLIPRTTCEFYNGGTKPACFGLNYVHGKYCLIEDHVKKSEELRNHFSQVSTLTLGQPCNLDEHNILYAPEKTEAIEDRFKTLDSLSSTDAKFCNSKSFLYCNPSTEKCELKFPEFQDKSTGNLWAWPFVFNTCEALGDVRDVLSSNHYVELEEGNYFTDGIPECPDNYECDMSNVCLCPDQKSIGKNCDEIATDLLKFARKSGIAIDAASENEQLTMISRLNQAALQFEGKFKLLKEMPCKVGVGNQVRKVARRLRRFKNKNILWTKAEIEKLTNDIGNLLKKSDYCQYGLYPHNFRGKVIYGYCNPYRKKCSETSEQNYLWDLIAKLGRFETLTCGEPCYTLGLDELNRPDSDMNLAEKIEIVEEYMENNTEFCTTNLMSTIFHKCTNGSMRL